MDRDTAYKKIMAKRHRRYERNRCARGSIPALLLVCACGYLAQRGLSATGATADFYLAAVTVVPLLVLALLIDIRVFNAFEGLDPSREWWQTILRPVLPAAVIIVPLAYIEIHAFRVLALPTKRSRSTIGVPPL